MILLFHLFSIIHPNKNLFKTNFTLLYMKKEGKNKKNTLKNIHRTKLTMGQKAADRLTKWGGSWFFIITFLIFIFIWMAINFYGYMSSWDPYPFILLNLVLSCLAAIQAPIILMSQNRGSQKDRLRTEYDYIVDRKTQRDIQELKKQLTRIEKRLIRK
ncbi:DUF1003 domain-containing protein [Candidatus Pacearchaeota archaeon]|nr:DUF1003 domain-containing protein [Candidatus Pacearchaeota archaeon]